MLDNSRNVDISGGHLYNVHGNAHISHGGGQSGFELLAKAIAASAFHDAEERFPPPKCHPNTREAILRNIMSWITDDTSKGSSPPILWLYGPAGAGKSAIAQTIAEKCGEPAVARLASSFFFSRRTSDRNSDKHLVATISYQLTQSIEKTKPIIENVVHNDPLIFSRAVNAQFSKLVIEPLLQVSKGSDPRKVIIIDGLDECDGDDKQCGIIDVICTAVSRHRLPFCFLVASRPEPHIRDAFNHDKLFKLSRNIPLIEDSESNNDVSKYLRSEFKRIAQERRLPTTWPADKDIETIMGKASGHFIYPSTVIKFIDDRRHYPPDRLKTILGINTACDQSPFADLDALYREILKPTSERDGGTLRIIGLLLCITDKKSASPPLVQHLLNLPPGRLESLLYDVHSIVDVPNDLNDVGNPIRITHASLIDFIADRSRSGDYFLDTKNVHADITQMCFRVLTPGTDVEGTGRTEVCQYALNSWYTHLQEAAPTPGLLDFFTQYASAETALDRMDELQRNMRHWLGKPDVQALMLLWLKKHNIQDICPSLYLSYRFLFDREIISIVDQSPSPDLLIKWIAILADLSAHLAVYAMTQALAMLFEIPVESSGEPKSLIPLRGCLGKLFEVGMESYPDLFEEFFSDASRSGKYFIGCEVHTEITLLLLRYIDKCMSDSVLDDGLPYAAAWHRESLRRHLSTLKWWRHWSFHLSRSSPSSEELVKFLNKYSSSSFQPVMQVHDGVDFGHFNNRLSINDMQKSVTCFLLRNAEHYEGNASCQPKNVTVRSRDWFKFCRGFLT